MSSVRYSLGHRLGWWWYTVTFRFHRHELCEPGCWEEFRGPNGETWFPHCWRCCKRMTLPLRWDHEVYKPGGAAVRGRNTQSVLEGEK